MNSNFVKAAGGCSAPSLADMDAVMARLGKMKMKFIETGPQNSINKAEFLISHPNYSGLQFNQLTRAEIPAHFVNSIKIRARWRNDFRGFSRYIFIGGSFHNISLCEFRWSFNSRR